MKRLGLAVAFCLLLSATAVMGNKATADTGGPDEGGYTWTDTQSPNPTTTYDYIDIIDSGTDLEFGDDDSQGIELPFVFTYYGTEYFGMVVSSNGFVSFNADDPNGCNENYNWDDTLTGPNGAEAGFPIPYGDADCSDDGWGANPLIATWFTDQDPSECGAVWYDIVGTAPDRTIVVQWNVCNDDDPTGDIDCSVDFEMLLFEGSNDIKMQYRDTTYSCGESTHDEDDGAYATVGLNLDGTTGLQYLWNDPILEPELAILYSTDSVEPEPTDTPRSCIPGLPPTYSCGGQPGGGSNQGKQTPLATPTPATSETPAVTGTAAVQPTLPAATATRPVGNVGGVITAPDTGSGPGSGGNGTGMLMLAMASIGALALSGGLFAARKRR